MSRQTSKQMAKEICHDNIFSVATQRTEYRRRVRLRQKIACRDKTREECNKSAKIKKLMLRQGLSVGCQHQEEPVMT